MHFIPLTPKEEKEMFDRMEIKSFSDLSNIIPPDLRLKQNLNIGDSLSEFDISNELAILSNKNNSNGLNFLGNGSYDHFIPAAIDFITSRSEFYTAYTPYQAEVSQGTLQYLYEFQSMICELAGMDIANASLYDGASALAEACSLAINSNNKTTILFSETIDNKYLNVMKTYFLGQNIKFIKISENDGFTKLSEINHYNDVSAIIIQSPNKYGLIEKYDNIKDLTKEDDTLLISIADPISLSILKPPGECGADIYIGEGQSIGNYMNYGGPYLGLMAVKEKLKRKMPGRIIGKTNDINNKSGFVLALQTREQHIRRAKATSNICTNQGLLALRATIYLALLGKEGLPYIANLCFKKSHYAASQISKLDNFELAFSNHFIKEFIIKTTFSAKYVVNYCKEKNIFIDDLKDDNSDNLIRIAVTEKRTRKNIDFLVSTLKEIK